VKLPICLHVVLKLRMSGAKPILLLDAFIACTGITFIIHYFLNSKIRSHFYNVGVANIRTFQCTLQFVHQQINTTVCLGVVTDVQRF